MKCLEEFSCFQYGVDNDVKETLEGVRVNNAFVYVGWSKTPVAIGISYPSELYCTLDKITKGTKANDCLLDEMARYEYPISFAVVTSDGVRFFDHSTMREAYQDLLKMKSESLASSGFIREIKGVFNITYREERNIMEVRQLGYDSSYYGAFMGKLRLYSDYFEINGTEYHVPYIFRGNI